MTPNSQPALPVVYLAAGRGSRLGELTAEIPKAMVQVAGRPLIDRSLEYLRAAGFTRFVAVTGHAASKFADYDVETVFNDRWDSENNVRSLWCVREIVAGGCVIVNCDLLFEAHLAERLAATAGTAILVDDELAVDEESMKATESAGSLARLHKAVALDAAVGEYIGLTRIDPSDGPRMAEILQEFIDRQETDVYYEDAIEQLARERHVAIERVGGTLWVEIDDDEDLARADDEIGPKINQKEPIRR